MKPLKLFVLLLLIFLGSSYSASAQEVKKVKALVGFQGSFQKWGEKRGDAVYPKTGFSIFEVEAEAFVVIPSSDVTPIALANTINRNEKLQIRIFGESYDAYKKKGKKKKKPKPPTIEVVCENDPNCNGTCYAIVASDGDFVRCGGNCCKVGNGFMANDVGIAETALY